MSEHDVNAKFLANVFSVAKSTGQATTKCVELLKVTDWADKEFVAQVALEFRLGRIASYLSLATRDQAMLVAEKSQWVEGQVLPGSTHRTEREQGAYRAGVSAWTHCANLAGKPTKKGKPRAPKVAAVKAEMQQLTPEAAIFALPKAKAAEDATAFAVRIAGCVVAYQKANATLVGGSLARIFTTFAMEVAQIADGRVDPLKIDSEGIPAPVAKPAPVATMSKADKKAARLAAIANHAQAPSIQASVSVN
jgi:hypothetical protein